MFKFRYCFFLIVCNGLFFVSKATHNRAGEITYKWISGYTYEIKVTTYTNIGPSIQADRCADTVYFGDGTRTLVLRSNGPSTICSPLPGKDGEIISPTIKLNEYIAIHTYPGPGNYRISMEDPNRNADVINIPNSVNQVFYVESWLVISTFIGPNSSPVLSFPPIDKGCTSKCFFHNPGAVDLEGDSLSYELTECRGSGGVPIPGYSNPATGSGGTYNINAVDGTLTWCTPQRQGEYNLAIKIKEWRKTADGIYTLVGYIIRDMQVDVGTCNNNPPVIQILTDTCIMAGSSLTKQIIATDIDADVITLSAEGTPFEVSPPAATFASVPTLTLVQGTFNWQTACKHIRKTPYQVTIKAKDNDPNNPLVDFKTFNITVVAPPPLNLSASPLGTNINLQWQKPTCQLTTGNKIEGYKIYRKSDCTPWLHGYCETGVPAYTGFTLIGNTSNINIVTFTDTNNGNGLIQGTNYSYLVIAVYTDGAESFASNQVCAQLKRETPILTNVDVQTTDQNNGSVFIRWIKPLLGTNALDTISNPGPYEFRLVHRDGFGSGTYTTAYSVIKPYFKSLNQLSDTTFIHNGINTNAIAHTYKIEFYANNQFIGSGQSASSVFLSLLSEDRKITLSWQQQVPWGNYKYRIWKKSPGQPTFLLVDSTSAVNYIDSNLVNRATYCYKIETMGQYSDTSIVRPLINFSQEVCAKPIDTNPPCAPKLEISSSCEVPQVSLKWNNPNHSCSEDVIKYYLYFAETEDAPLVFIDSINVASDTIVEFDNLSSIAGCYAITAIDSSYNQSAQSEKICIDNCPEYELPNVISANGDSINDFFKAIKNKFIKSIDLKVYNRWGTLVYETTDPGFLWDGKVIQTKQLATEGTYFYVCEVYEIRVSGIKQRNLKGFLQIFRK